MQIADLPFEILSTVCIDVVYKEVGVDAEKVQNSLKLIREWLKCESYLPNDVDETLLKNFILGSKGNLERVKDKLEKYLTAKTKIAYLYHDRTIKDNDFLEYPYHRFFYVCPKQMPDGNRLLLFKLPRKEPINFDYGKMAKYFCLVCDVLLLYDTSAGYHFIYDLGWLSPQYMAKVNLNIWKQIAELIFNVFPFRIRSLLLVNENSTVHIVMNIAKAFMSKKLKDRIFSVRPEDLPKYHSIDYLPKEYGGNLGNHDDVCDQMLEMLKQNSEWCKESELLKLAGSVPEHKKKFYSFDDYCMEGGFRTLSID